MIVVFQCWFVLPGVVMLYGFVTFFSLLFYKYSRCV